MNTITVRAAALQALINSNQTSQSPEPMAQAVLACCADLVNAGEIVLASDLLNSALFLERMNDPELMLRLAIVRARVLRARGRFEESLRLTLDTLVACRDLLRLRPVELAELRINEAASLTQLNRADEAVHKLYEVRNELLSGPDSSLLAWCAYQLSAAELIRGNAKEAKQYSIEALVSARRCNNALLEARALDNISRLERAYCRWSSAEEAASDALTIFERHGYGFYSVVARRCLAIVLWKRGRLDDAYGVACESLEGAQAIGSPLHEWYASLLKGMILLHAGKFEQSSKIFSSGPGWEVPRAESRPSLLTTEFIGDVHLEQGDARAALRHYDDVWPKALALVPRGDIVAELRRRRAECYLILSDCERSYSEAKVGLEHCREISDRYEEAATYRVLAMASAALDRQTEAKRWFDQGFAYYDDIETPYEWGKLWLAYGDWLASGKALNYGGIEGAVEAYQAARDHFERMGAAGKCSEVELKLKQALRAEMPRESIGDGEPRHSRRRPRGAAELERKSQWAQSAFGLVTRDRTMLRMLEDVEKLARSTAPVLVLGESGTGKELVAHGLHRLSGRSGSFVPINCAALPREIIESELFGHVAGAFTGATRDKPGLLEVCNGGTVFLDEIAEMGVELQSRLLRFLETGEVRRVGATRAVAVQTRVVAATNRDRAALERGEGFRTDLYYRLAHAVIELPPLRRRADDVELLIDKFLEQVCTEEGKTVTISVEARSRLKAYTWPGNVRQLKAAIRRVVILASSDHEVRQGDLQLDDGQAPTTLLEELEQAERRRINDAMRSAKGSRTEAARSLGMPRTTLINKLKRFGLF